MSKILYYHTGSGNHGCEALVRSTVTLLSESVSLFSTGIEEDLKYEIDEIVNLEKDEVKKLNRHSLKYLVAAIQIKLTGSTTIYNKFSRSKFLSKVKKNDICLSIGGDNYCYNGVEILGDLNYLLKKRGAKTVLWGCSIDQEVLSGPVVTDLKNYDLITVRESLTLKALEKVGISKNVKKVADTAFLLEANEIDLPHNFTENTIGINLSPLIFDYTDKQTCLINAFYTLIQEILDTTTFSIALIPHVVKIGNNDLDILRDIYNKFESSKRIILIPDMNCMQLKYVISKCRFFIGSRTHATIAAYSSCVPTLVIGYSAKSRGIATDLFGTDKNYVIPVQKISDENVLKEGFRWLLKNEFQIIETLKTVIPKYQEEARIAKKFLNDLER